MENLNTKITTQLRRVQTVSRTLNIYIYIYVKNRYTCVYGLNELSGHICFGPVIYNWCCKQRSVHGPPPSHRHPQKGGITGFVIQHTYALAKAYSTPSPSLCHVFGGKSDTSEQSKMTTIYIYIQHPSKYTANMLPKRIAFSKISRRLYRQKPKGITKN